MTISFIPEIVRGQDEERSGSGLWKTKVELHVSLKPLVVCTTLKRSKNKRPPSIETAGLGHFFKEAGRIKLCLMTLKRRTEGIHHASKWLAWTARGHSWRTQRRFGFYRLLKWPMGYRLKVSMFLSMVEEKMT